MDRPNGLIVENEGTAPKAASPFRKDSVKSPLRQRLQYRLLLLAVLGLAFAIWHGFAGCEELALDPEATAVQPRRSAAAFDLSRTTIPQDEIRAGGPPKDGIPSLTNPKLIPGISAKFLRAGDRIVGVVVDGESRAYPLRILDYHEAVNDRIGKTPFAVTYCPLCDSAAVFDRRRGDSTIEFGISGLLHNSNVLLYDRGAPGKESLWSQIAGKAVSEPRVDSELKSLPFEVTTWAEWLARHPETKVLSPDTGHDRDYQRSPYASYFASPELMFPVKPLDRRLPLKTPVLGVTGRKRTHRAYPVTAFSKSELQNQRLNQELDGLKFTVVYNPNAKSIRIENPDDSLQWMYAFWFAWAAFHPETELFESSRP